MSNIEQYLKERNIPTDSLEAKFHQGGCSVGYSNLVKWLRFNTNWDDEWDEMGRNVNYGKIEELRSFLFS